MICLSCRDRRHGECRGGTWCDCQHQPGPATPQQRDQAAADAAGVDVPISPNGATPS